MHCGSTGLMPLCKAWNQKQLKVLSRMSKLLSLCNRCVSHLQTCRLHLKNSAEASITLRDRTRALR